MSFTGRITSPEALGLMLQQGRLVRGMTQRDLADRLGISQRYVWEMEAGKPSLAMERLFAIARETGVQLSARIDVSDAEGDHG